MALSRRTGARFQGSIWPGFVDAMTGLLLVLMFVLTIFMVLQAVQTQRINGQENELNSLSGEVAALAQALLEREQILTGDILHQDVGGRLELPELEDVDDVRMAQVHAQLRLVDEHLDELFVLGEVRQDSLEREETICAR